MVGWRRRHFEQIHVPMIAAIWPCADKRAREIKRSHKEKHCGMASHRSPWHSRDTTHSEIDTHVQHIRFLKLVSNIVRNIKKQGAYVCTRVAGIRYTLKKRTQKHKDPVIPVSPTITTREKGVWSAGQERQCRSAATRGYAHAVRIKTAHRAIAPVNAREYARAILIRTVLKRWALPSCSSRQVVKRATSSLPSCRSARS